MTQLLVDTCVLIHLVKQSSQGNKCAKILSNSDSSATLIASVVTKAEFSSFALQNKWGQAKLDKLQIFLDTIIYVDISLSNLKLLAAYNQIDAFSKRKGTDKNGNILSGSARKMGKNDLWIAATAMSLEIPVMTTDGDFDHLHNTLLEVIKIS